MDLQIARQLNHCLEPLVAHTYFAEEANEEYRAIGLKPWPTGYFASRGYGLGECTPAVLHAAFFNFAYDVATFGIPECWEKASPTEIGAARDRAVVRALERMTRDATLPDLRRVEELMRIAVAACPTQGRTLFAGTAAMPWPEDPPLLAVWHGGNRLREFRGDGHIAALVAAGIGPTQALVMYAAMRGSYKSALMHSRQVPAEEWEAVDAELTARGLIKDRKLTQEGAELREAIEETTDRLAMAPWLELGEERSQELRQSVKALSTVICEAGGVVDLLYQKLQRMG